MIRALHRSTHGGSDLVSLGLGILLLCVGVLGSPLASAAPSVFCPTLNANVVRGGSVAINVSSCDGPFDGGMSGPIAPFAQHGTVSIGSNSFGIQNVAYAHNGDSATSDSFQLEDNNLGVVTVNVTITSPPTSIIVSPASLPTLAAGSAFTQTLTSTGGSSPYTYTHVIANGALPVGLTLTSAGVLAGTPTQRGAYSFSVESRDSLNATSVKGYAGIVQAPTLAVTPLSGVATQGVPFSATLSTTGGVAPVSYQLESGSFPSGISISSGGVISGTTAAAVGNYPVTLKVSDSSTGGGVYFELKAFTLTVTSTPLKLTITTQPSATASSGAAFAQQPAIQLRDAANNAVSQAGVIVAATISTGVGSLVGTTTATTNASGLATFSNLGLSGAVSSYKLTFTAAGLTSTPESNTITLSAGAASKLTITTQPSATAASGAAFVQQPAIQLRDANDNAVSQVGVVVTATISTGTGSLVGTTTATTNASGVATFTNLGLSGTVGSYKLTFTATGLTSSPESSAITLSAGSANKLTITTQPSATSTIGAAFAQQPSIQVRDSADNAVSQAGTVVTATISTGTGSFVGTTTATTNASGLATFTNLGLTGAAGSYKLTFTASGLTSTPESSAITLSAGAANKLTITTQPSTSATSGAAFVQQPAIQLRDAADLPVSQAGVVVSATISTGTGSLVGTTTATTNASGVATFTNLGLSGTAGTYKLTFTATGLTATPESGAIALSAGAATKLTITTQPSASTTSGAAFAQQPAIQLRDANDNAVSQAGIVVTATISAGTGSLVGTTTATTNASGVATFTNLGLSGTAGTYKLTFTATSLTATPESNAITLSAGAATKLTITTQPSASTVSGAAFAQQPAIQLRDASDNAVSQAGVVVTATISTGTGSLVGTTTATTNASGLATFTNLGLSGTAGTYRLTFTATALTATPESSAITISVGAATKLTIATQPSATAISGVIFAQQPAIQLRDASDNAVSQAGVVVTATISTGSGSLVGAITTTTNAGGLATFGNLGLSGAAGTYKLTFTATGLTATPESSAIALAAGSAAKLTITTQPSASAASGAAFVQQPAIQLRDAADLPVSQAGFLVTATISTGTGSLVGTSTTTTNANGVANFGDLGLSGTVGTYKLTFTAIGLTPTPETTAIVLSTGSAAKLTITAQPSATATSGAAFGQQPAIQLRDSGDNAVSQGGVLVTVTISTGTGSLVGTTTATTNPGGVATFTNLGLSGSAGTYKLTFTAASLAASPETNPITLSAGAAAKLTITTQPSASAASGAAFAQQPAIQVRDTNDNSVSQAGVVVTATISTGTGSLVGTTTATTNASGVATFTNLGLSGSAGTYRLIFTATSLTATPQSGAIALSAGAVTKLTITTQPSATATSGVAFAQQPAIQVRDTGDNAVSQAGVVVTATISTGTGSLVGTTTATTNASGLATFTNLGLSGSAGTYKLTFTAAGLAASPETNPITLSAGAAAKLTITTQPSASTVSGAAFAQQPAIQLRDAGDNAVSQTGVVVTATISTGTGSLVGTTTATTNASGLATFTNLGLSGTTGAYKLTFTATGLTSTPESSAIALSAGAATKLTITTQPSATATSGVAFAQQPAIQVRDAGDNAVSEAGVVVTATISTGTGSLVGTTTATTNASGVATFATLGLSGAAGAYKLTFTAAGLTATPESSAIALSAGAATKLTITTQPSSIATAGSAFAQQPAIQVRDAGDNAVSQAGVVVTATISTGTGSLVGTTTATTNASGVATFATLGLSGAAGTYKLTFTATGLTSTPESSAITLSAGTATKLAFTTQPGGGTVAAVWGTQPVVVVQDANNGTVTGATNSIALSITTPGGATLTCTSNPVDAVGGIATFTGCRIDTAGTYTLTATSAGLAQAVSSSFLIGPADQTITFNALPARTLGDPDFPVTATATSGLAVVFASTTPDICSTGGVNGRTIHLYTAGTCTIRATQPGNTNWNPAPNVDQSFAVTLPAGSGTVINGPTGAGTATVSPGSGTWVFAPSGTGPLQSGGFIPVQGNPKSPPTPPPPGMHFPFGLLDFVAIGGTPGSTMTIVITYPAPVPPGAQYLKYGATAADPSPHWYVYPNAVISGNTVTLTVTDGGAGDSDLVANSIIVDPGGPAVALDAQTVPVPTLSQWGMVLMSILLLLTAILHGRRRTK